MLRIAVSSMLVALAVACSRGDERQPPADVADGEATPTAMPTAAAAAARSDARDIEPGVLVIDWSPREGWDPGRAGAARGALVALDAATGEELPSFGPAFVGQAGFGVPSPDGSLIALIRYETQSSGPDLVILDAALEAGGDAALPPRVKWTAWHTDRSRLYAVRPARVHANPVDEVWVVEMEAGDTRLLTSLDFEVWHGILVAPSGDRLYLLGRHAGQCCGLAVQGPPFIAEVDLDTGAVSRRAELPEVLAVQRREQHEDGEHYAIHRPGVALSPDGSRLYVVHSDEDRVTVVDLERMEVAASVALDRDGSRLTRLGSWLRDRLVSRAEAKGGLYFHKQAAVSVDGRWLYVSGSEDVIGEEVRHLCCERRPLGLQVIDVESMRLVDEVASIGEFAISPDGRWLVGIGTRHIERPSETGIVGHGAKIVDLRTHEVVARLRPGVAYWQLAVSPDSRYAYLASQGPGSHPGVRCERDCQRIEVVDLLRGEVVAERLFDGHVSLIGLAATR